MLGGDTGEDDYLPKTGRFLEGFEVAGLDEGPRRAALVSAFLKM